MLSLILGCNACPSLQLQEHTGSLQHHQLEKPELSTSSNAQRCVASALSDPEMDDSTSILFSELLTFTYAFILASGPVLLCETGKRSKPLKWGQLCSKHLLVWTGYWGWRRAAPCDAHILRACIPLWAYTEKGFRIRERHAYCGTWGCSHGFAGH